MSAVHLIDASPYLFRAWFSLPDMRAPDGSPVSACYGWVSFLARYLREEEPTHVAACFDESLNTSFRNDVYPAYKSTREEAPPDLVAQLRLCQDLSEAMGVRAFAHGRYEADDLIGTLAARFVEAGEGVVVVTSDKDLAQLVGPRVELFDFARGARIGEEGVRERWGIDPRQVPDYLGLAGDAVDAIPGVKGVGAKTAAALLSRYADLDALYAELGCVAELPLRGARALGAKLAAGRDDAFLSRSLATIATDAPVSASLDDLAWRGADPARIDELFARLGFETIRGRVPRWR